ncbi:MAG: TetR/AcrR family transcriptional regulator [Phycisphaerae bacterium]
MSPASSTRERIVEAAMDLFVRQGYERTGLAQIAKVAEAKPGSIYHFFPTKEDLLKATLEKRLVDCFPIVMAHVWKRVDDPLERIFGVLDGYRQMLLMTEYEHGCPIGNLVLEVAESLPGTRPLLAANFDNWKSFIAECFENARDRLPEDSDPNQLATFVLTTMEGAVMLARTYRNLDAWDAAIAMLRDYVDRLVADGRGWDVSHANRSNSN